MMWAGRLGILSFGQVGPKSYAAKLQRPLVGSALAGREVCLLRKERSILMSLLSINEVTTFRWSFEEDVERYAAAGVPAIGVWRQKLSDCGEEKAAELLKAKGLEVATPLWA